MFTNDKSAQARLTEIVGRGVTLPALPEVGAELIAIARQPIDKIDVTRVVNLIERDAGLTARILQMANSPFFGVTGGVASLRKAITIIGLEETVNVLNFHLVMNTIPAFPEVEGFSNDNFWAHSWACAMAARMLGRPQLLVQAMPGTLYLAGLLHDVGKAVLALHLPREFAASLRLARDQRIPLQEAEWHKIGIDHALLGGHLLGVWNLPATVAAATAFQDAPENAEPADRELAGLIQFANIVAEMSEADAGDEMDDQAFTKTWIVMEGRSPLARKETRDEVVGEIRESLKRKAKILSGVGEDSTPGKPSVSEGSHATGDSAGKTEAPTGDSTVLWRRIVDGIRSLFGA
jgi:HD-like signal output (HDOD) protein